MLLVSRHSGQEAVHAPEFCGGDHALLGIPRSKASEKTRFLPLVAQQPRRFQASRAEGPAGIAPRGGVEGEDIESAREGVSAP